MLRGWTPPWVRYVHCLLLPFIMLIQIGWVGLTNKPATSNSSIVQLLESMGAVLYVKTNIPQSLMVGYPHLKIDFSFLICSRWPTRTIMSLVNLSTPSITL